MKARFALTVLMTLTAMILVSRAPLWSAGSPTDQIRGTVDKVLAILGDPSLSSDAKSSVRRDHLRRAIFPTFDFAEMAKRSLGSHWRRRSGAEQKEFVDLFTDLLQNSYVGSIESYHGDKVVYRREVVDKNYAEVGTSIHTAQGQEYSINYRLHLWNSEWKVYDVVIENISLVNNYRSQFNRVISKSSFEDLLRMIKEKQT
jgi:phospholipid transport system substrate-binding protein